jgi:tetratricopeptide (TPR) repeat protein
MTARTTGLVVCLGFALLAAGRAWTWGRLQTANANAAYCERSVNNAIRQGTGHLPRRLLDDNIGLLERAIEVDPTLIEARVALGGHLYLLRRMEQSEQAYQGALALERRAEVYTNLVRLALIRDDRAAAAEMAATAVALDPQLADAFGEMLKQYDLRRTPRSEDPKAKLFGDSFENGKGARWHQEPGRQEPRPAADGKGSP